MKTEIGGYLELDSYQRPRLHENALALNSGRACLEYLISQKKIQKIALPYFVCDVVVEACQKHGLDIRFYHINEHFLPVDAQFEADRYMYIVNFYGQLEEVLESFKSLYPLLIVDNAQAYFSRPLVGVDTLYTCRKFFGVSDGAFLYTDAPEKELPQDSSYQRMGFVLGRYECPASQFYAEASANNDFFSSQPVSRMSRLTDNLLRAIDYEQVKNTRSENFALLHRELASLNKLSVKCPEGSFAYPLLLENGGELRKSLAEKKVFIPTLWPNVLNDMDESSLEYKFAKNILPLPCDQRYGEKEMLYMSQLIKSGILPKE